ncbi:MAG: NAD(P)-binding protein [Okeania sp. SIO2D1]|nr:NAD(P)-binding protein [Okeania sp. SIO2C9]NES64385.1 NAD(P)-binding protein [Okeania sp. SIO2D1]
MVDKVAIIGAGPGGLATAIALRKQGIDAHVYEKAREFRPVGAGVSLKPNGLRCIDAIKPGLVNKLRRLGFQVQRTTLKTSTGETVWTTKTPINSKDKELTFAIWWWHLQRILASELPSEVIHLNHRCVSFEQNEKTVTTQFENGKTVEVDLLIGADGINSRVREILIGDRQPTYSGSMCWRAIVDYRDELLLPDEGLIIRGEKTAMILYPLGEGKMNWSAGKLFPESFVCPSAAEVKFRVLKEFSNWMKPILQMIEETDAESILEAPICKRLPLQQWSYGRVTLLGDAVHGMSPGGGQGANTTFEDAYELAECLYNFPDLKTALANYDKRRLQRTVVIQNYSEKMEKLAYKSIQEQNKQSEQNFAEFERWLFDYDPKSESRLKPWKEKVVI